MGSLSSSEALRARRGSLSASLRGLLAVVVFGSLAATASGCVTVRPEQREFLADPSMTFGSGGQAAADEEHVLSNREGSYGAGGVTGGGCGCN